jgi:hypothetical protein
MMGTLKFEKYKDVENLWKNRIKESTRLEFKKEIDTNNKEIAKDISAIANAEGGFIIYGLEEDDKGRAKFSGGVAKEKGSVERLQQIVDSHIHPPLAVEIIPIEARSEKGQILEDKEFLVVKVPQSFYHIHQVETTGRYYIRSGNTVRRMNEIEIEGRYELRFKERADQRILVKEKEAELKGRQNVNEYMLCGSISHVKYGPPVNITEELFRTLLFMGTRHQVTHLYHKISDFTFPNYPKEGGRFAEEEETKQYLEINDNRSMFLFYPVRFPDRLFFDCFLMFIDFLSVVNNFYLKIAYGGGMTILLKIEGIKGIMRPDSINLFIARAEGELERIKEESMTIEVNVESIPFDLRNVSFKFFEEFWRRLHIDDPMKTKSGEVEHVEKWIDVIEKSLARVS